MFISFEGIDGTGKTTQATRLVQFLTEKGVSAIYVREPGGTEIGEKIRSILKAGGMTEKAALLLFCAARETLIQQVIKPSIKNGVIVVTDRFLDSTVAYQGFASNLDLCDVESTIHFATDGLLPDITFYLKCDLETSRARSVVENGREVDARDNASMEISLAVLRGYDYCVKKDPNRFKIVDASADQDTVFKQVTDHLFASVPELAQA